MPQTKDQPFDQNLVYPLNSQDPHPKISWDTKNSCKNYFCHYLWKKISPMIQLIITGGTFDKTYDLIHGKLFFERTHIPKMLERSRCKLSIDVLPLMLKDSLELTEEDLDQIIDACQTTPAQSIVITHGTDTMVDTAKRLAAAKLKKTIILTGAMIPYAFGSSSDGFFNLGCAIAFAQTLDPNVYIAMQGQYFLWNEVQKNKSLGLFEKLAKPLC